MILLALVLAVSQTDSVRPIAPQDPGTKLPAAVPRDSSGNVEPKVEALLAQRDTHVPPERWRALGPRALPLLEGIAADGNALPTRRARALEGMVALRSARAPDVIQQLARSEAAPFVLRLAAARGAAHVFGPSRRLLVLRPMLENASDPHLRAAAAEILSRHPKSCPAVREQARKEQSDARVAFSGALRRCGEAP